MLHPVTTRAILQSGFERRTVDAFDAFHLLMPRPAASPTAAVLPLRRAAAADRTQYADPGRSWRQTRSAPTAASARGPISSALCDLAAWAVPSGFGADGLPGGVVTIAGPAWSEGPVGSTGGPRASCVRTAMVGNTTMDHPAASDAEPASVGPDETALFCIGGHMTGLPLNSQLTERGGRFVAVARTRAGLPDVCAGQPALVCSLPLVEPPLPAKFGRLPTAAIGALAGRRATPARLRHRDARERAMPRLPGRSGWCGRCA